MSDVMKDPLVRTILYLTLALMLVGLLALVYDLLLSVSKGQLLVSGTTTLSDIYGHIIAAILVVGWGLISPLTEMRSEYYFKYRKFDEAVEAVRTYFQGTITREELLQILDRIKGKS
jgi:hypothetical protein